MGVVILISRRRAKIGTRPIVAYYWEKGAQRFLSKQDTAFAHWGTTFAPKGRAPQAGERWVSPAHGQTLRPAGHRGLADGCRTLADSRFIIQTKSTVNEPSYQHQQEANQVPDTVMPMSFIPIAGPPANVPDLGNPLFGPTPLPSARKPPDLGNKLHTLSRSRLDSTRKPFDLGNPLFGPTPLPSARQPPDLGNKLHTLSRTQLDSTRQPFDLGNPLFGPTPLPSARQQPDLGNKLHTLSRTRLDSTPLLNGLIWAIHSTPQVLVKSPIPGVPAPNRLLCHRLPQPRGQKKRPKPHWSPQPLRVALRA